MGNAMRLRGRPRGSGKNDAPYLAKVAELLIGDPSLKPYVCDEACHTLSNGLGRQ